MTKPHPVTHSHVINNADPVTWRPHDKVHMVSSLISFWLSNLLTEGVAMTNHIHMFNAAHPVTCSLYAQFHLDWSIK